MKTPSCVIPQKYRQLHSQQTEILSSKLEPRGLPLGIIDDGTGKMLALPAKERDKVPHVLIIDAVGTARTALLMSMIAHDILANEMAVVLFDSDGTLSSKTEQWMRSQTDKATTIERIMYMTENAVEWQELLDKRKVLIHKGGVKLENIASMMSQLREVVMGRGQGGRVPQVVVYFNELEPVLEPIFDELLFRSEDALGIVCAVRNLHSLPVKMQECATIRFGCLVVTSADSIDAPNLSAQMFRCEPVECRQTPDCSSESLCPCVLQGIAAQEAKNSELLINPEPGSLYCYLVGTLAGTFRMQIPWSPT